MSQGTEQTEARQPSGEDVPSLQDVAQTLKLLSGRIETVEATSRTLKATIDRLKQTLDGHKTTLDGLKQTVDGHETTLDGHKTTLDGLKDHNTRQDQKINALKRENQSLKRFMNPLRLRDLCIVTNLMLPRALAHHLRLEYGLPEPGEGFDKWLMTLSSSDNSKVMQWLKSNQLSELIGTDQCDGVLKLHLSPGDAAVRAIERRYTASLQPQTMAQLAFHFEDVYKIAQETDDTGECIPLFSSSRPLYISIH